MTGMGEWGGMPFYLAIGFALAFLAPFLVRSIGPRAFALLSLYPASGLALFAPVREAEWSTPWVASLGIDLAFRLDGLGRAFVLLICLLGTLILLYASGYFPKYKPNLGRFAGAFIGFMAAMLGTVLSDDLISLFIFWELTSITSFLLIGFYHKEAESRVSAQQAFLITGAGALVMLVGLLMLGQEMETFRVSEFDGFPSVVPLILILVGCATKSAQFPFHFWLPNAMAAPTPVSAFLHSATMVKAGIFLLARLHPWFSQDSWFGLVLPGLGSATIVVAAMLVLWHRDLKKMLAYSTVMALGLLCLLLGLPGKEALLGFSAFLCAHALYKGGLFLLAGAIDHGTGSRDALALRGLGRQMPVSRFAGLLLAGSGLGLVGFIGFHGKEYAILGAGYTWWILPVIVFALASGVVVLRVAIWPFWGRESSHPDAHEAPWPMLVGPVLLGLVGVAAAIGIPFLGSEVLNPLSGALQFALFMYDWAFFPGVNWAFMLSLVLIALAVIGSARLGPIPKWTPRGLDDGWRLVIPKIASAAKVPTAWIQTGLLRNYFALFFLLISVAGSASFWLNGGRLPTQVSDYPYLHELALIFLAIGATGAVMRTPSRLSAICMMGLVGTAISVLYLVFGAPDLAVTQILTELLTVIIAALVFSRLPKFRSLSSRVDKIRDASIAAAFGITMGTLAWAAQGVSPDLASSRFFSENSVEKAYGRNVVNTILVDFRAMDTLGEVTVLCVAALGVYALMHLRGPKETDA